MPRILASAFLGRAIVAMAVGGLATSAFAGPDSPAARVIVVANADDPDSLPLAEYYAQARGVPRANIFSFRMPLRETISWPEFVATIWQPLQDELIRGRWIEAAAQPAPGPPSSGGLDGIGRRRHAISGHRILALVVCRGVPLRIDDDPALDDRLAPVKGVLRTNAGAVDSELSLLAKSGGYPIGGFVPNPLFGRDTPNERELAQVVKVARLDGPTAADARSLVDGALAAEHTGLIGRAYVTIGGRGTNPNGDRWLDHVVSQISSMGWDASVDRDPRVWPESARCDAPALYFGWHEPDLGGPFALPGFRFPPGAIALHIHSYSARTLRSATEGWCGPLVARGAAATMGNVFEPFLELSQRPDLLIRALARGDDLVDAAYYSLPVLSWQCVIIGDPLYRPFTVPLRTQLENLDGLPPELAGYPVLRLMHLLDLAGKPGDATAAARVALNERPGLLALSMALARRLKDAGQPEEAAGVVAPVAGMKSFAPDQWALAREAAQLLASSRHPERAVEVYRHLFSAAALPLALRAPWLAEARKAALAASDPGQAAAWGNEADSIHLKAW